MAKVEHSLGVGLGKGKGKWRRCEVNPDRETVPKINVQWEQLCNIRLSIMNSIHSPGTKLLVIGFNDFGDPMQEHEIELPKTKEILDVELKWVSKVTIEIYPKDKEYFEFYFKVE